MTEGDHRLYHDLAWLWPMWGNHRTEYADYCDHLVRLIRCYARREMRTLLNIGCGGGKNAFNLKREFEVVGIDISPAMLELARGLNPECVFLQADMRDFSLGRRFDGVLIDDAVSYMTTEADLEAVFQGAYEHLEPGGVMIVGPDETKETFRQNKTCVSHAESSLRPANVDVVFIENYYDPDPRDTVYEGMMIYLIREDGRLKVEQDRHILGLFPAALWRRLLDEVGLELHEETYRERGEEYLGFICIKP